MTVTYAKHADLGLITFSNPPVNALSISGGLVSQLSNIVVKAIGDESVRVIIIAGEGKYFSAGADITDFDGDPDALDAIRQLNDQVEASPKPIVMMIKGLALGGGLELALAGHYRIAHSDARLGFPEITLGLLPGGGGTQRLPRLVGKERALDLMLSGKPVSAQAAKEFGLVDAIVSETVTMEEAFQTASELAADGPRPTGALAPAILKTHEQSLTQKSKIPTGTMAEDLIVKCVEAAAGDFDEGCLYERKSFSELMASTESQALRYAFFGEREVSRVPGLPKNIEISDVKNVAVIGAGTMGAGIALVMVNAGLSTVLIDPSQEALDRGVARIGSILDRDAVKKRISEDQKKTRLALLQPSQEIDALASADLIIEAVFEDIEVKRTVFTDIDRLAKKSAILATNTSTLDVNTIASFTSRPEQVVGLHFFSPANIMKLVEVIRGDKTSASVLASAMKFTRRIGKIGVVAGVCDGFIGNRIFEEYLRQAYFLLEEGALPAQLDGALERWGMAMGPLRTMDLAGQDIGWSIRKRRAVEQPDRPYSKIPDLICEMGRFGQKTGAGYYRYPDERSATPDPEIDKLIEEHSRAIGIERRDISDQEIVERCIYAMVNEGARILEEEIAYRAVDIDIIYLNGYGFPRKRGGPMHFADSTGLQSVLDRMAVYQKGHHGWAWEPSDLLIGLARKGASFAAA